MTPKQYAKIKVRDNEAFMLKYTRSKHSRFLAYCSNIVDCDMQMEINRKNEKEFLFFHETLLILVKEFENYCLNNKLDYLQPQTYNEK